MVCRLRPKRYEWNSRETYRLEAARRGKALRQEPARIRAQHHPRRRADAEDRRREPPADRFLAVVARERQFPEAPRFHLSRVVGTRIHEGTAALFRPRRQMFYPHAGERVS